MAVAVGKKKLRPFLQPTSTSASFQEALRLCRQGSARQRQRSDEEVTDPKDTDSNGTPPSHDSQEQDGGEKTLCTCPGSHLTGCIHGLSSVRMSLPGRDARPYSDSVTTAGRTVNVRISSVDRRMSSQLHVQWAEELVREHPRKRYERKPSVVETDLPRSILKH